MRLLSLWHGVGEVSLVGQCAKLLLRMRTLPASGDIVEQDTRTMVTGSTGITLKYASPGYLGPTRREKYSILLLPLCPSPHLLTLFRLSLSQHQ